MQWRRFASYLLNDLVSRSILQHVTKVTNSSLLHLSQQRQRRRPQAIWYSAEGRQPTNGWVCRLTGRPGPGLIHRCYSPSHLAHTQPDTLLMPSKDNSSYSMNNIIYEAFIIRQRPKHIWWGDAKTRLRQQPKQHGYGHHRQTSHRLYVHRT